MPADAPQTAAAAIAGFFGDLLNAATLRSELYRRVAADPQAWRRGAVVVMLAAVASDSLGLYTDLDELLVRTFANWSLLLIMLLALARWLWGSAVGWLGSRILGESIDYGVLLRSAGYGYAPQCLHLLPALLYWLGLVQVTLPLVIGIRLAVLPWTLAALTVAARAAGASSAAKGFAIGLLLFVGANLFDVLLDGLLALLVAAPAAVPLGADGIG